jgi:two-component system sensor histidine kinase QseC
MLLRSPNAPAQPLTTLERGFNSETKDHHEWRTFTLYNEGEQTWLIVAERDDERSELASKMATLTMLPLFITLPFLLGLLWWLITGAVTAAPAGASHRRASSRQPEPLNLAIKAEELTPLVGRSTG